MAAARSPSLLATRAFSSDADGTIVSHAWDFGDGGSAGGELAPYMYSAGGEYVVTLTVTDNLGATGTASVTVTVDPGGQVSGDCNQDGRMDLADSVCLSAHLFRGIPAVLP